MKYCGLSCGTINQIQVQRQRVAVSIYISWFAVLPAAASFNTSSYFTKSLVASPFVLVITVAVLSLPHSLLHSLLRSSRWFKRHLLHFIAVTVISYHTHCRTFISLVVLLHTSPSSFRSSYCNKISSLCSTQLILLYWSSLRAPFVAGIFLCIFCTSFLFLIAGYLCLVDRHKNVATCR